MTLTTATLPKDYHRPAEMKRLPALYTKVLDEDQGIVEEIFAVMGNIDHGRDRIQAGAFKKTITERGNRVLVLDMHNTDSILRVIGKPLSIREIGKNELPIEVRQRFPDATGAVLAKTQYLLDTPEGKGAFARIKAGAVNELSFGFDVTDDGYETIKARKTEDGWELDENGDDLKVRNINQVRLYEYSRVLWGMNPATTTVSVKKNGTPAEGKPWLIQKDGEKWCVYKEGSDGKPDGEALKCYDKESDAQDYMDALYANNPDATDSAKPRDMTRTFKSVSLTRMVSEIEGEFMEQFNPPDECTYWPIEVFDTHLIVVAGYGRDRAFYQVNYTMSAGGAITFAARGEWVEGAYQFVPKGTATPVESEDEMDQTESGLTASKATKAMTDDEQQALKDIRQACGKMIEMLGKMIGDGGDDEEETPDEEMAALPTGAAENNDKPTPTSSAGRAGHVPPTDEEKQRRLAVLKLEQQRLEVKPNGK